MLSNLSGNHNLDFSSIMTNKFPNQIPQIRCFLMYYCFNVVWSISMNEIFVQNVIF